MTDAPTERTAVKRLPDRGSYDRAVIDAILDEAVVCHVGFVVDSSPRVIPTLHARHGDHLLIHGSAASKMLRAAPTQEICVTVTLVDGFVVARSGFHHSMNYRSVMIYGTPEIVEGEEKLAGLDVIVDRLLPGRVGDIRATTDKEIRATTLLRLPLDEASAKIRDGWPVDDDEDYELPIWAGVVPISTVYGEPVADPRLHMDVPVPEYLTDYRRPGPA